MNALVPRDTNSALAMARAMSTGKLVPVHLQRSEGDCLMVIEQAMRWGMSPFAVAQCTSVIHGRLMFEGKLVAAAVHSSGILKGRLDYEFHGASAAREITVRGTLKGEDRPREVRVALKDVKTANGIWEKQPDQQLVYAATRVWARRHAPEVMLGVYAPEEFEPRAAAFTGTTIDAQPETPEPMPEPKMADVLGDSIPALDPEPPRPKRKIADVLAELERELAAADGGQVHEILSRPDAKRLSDWLTGAAKERWDAMVRTAMERTCGDAHEPDPRDALAKDGEIPF